MSDLEHVISKNYLPDSIDFKSGFAFLIDKPKTWTSFDVVNKLRFSIRHKLQVKKYKVGHSGTLDPMATGLLIICCGKYTKKLHDLTNQSKGYLAEVTFGATTPSYDAESEIDAEFPTDHLTAELIGQKLKEFEGDIMQKPPMFSAVKIDGQRLYKLARRGETKVIEPRPITIHQLSLKHWSNPVAELDTFVGKGTYIRSLAFDLGQACNSGAYLTALRRTQIDRHSVSNALSIEQATKWIEAVQPLESEE